MSIAVHQSQPKNTVRLIYRLQRLFFALCIVLGLLATLALVATSPQYYSLHNGVAVMFSTFAMANGVLMQAHFISGVLTIYLLPLSLLAMTWLAMRRSPWLASIVMLILFICLVPFAAFSAQDALTYDLARMGSNPLLLSIAQRFNDDGVMSYYNTLFIIGTVPAPALVGIALWRARAVPIWAALLIIVGRLLVFIYPFTANIPGVYLQLVSWLLLLIGSIPAALAMVKAPYAEGQLTQNKAGR